MAEGVDSRRFRGGIFKLRELIEEHPAELAYDFRSRFALSIESIGESVTYKEAILLVSILLRDPASWTQAAWSGWYYPVTREWIVASHTYELLSSVNSGKGKKPKPYPNPFPSRDSVRTGKTSRSTGEVIEILARMNPKKET